MGIFKKIKTLKIFKRIGLGVTDALGISSILKSNLDSKHITDEKGNANGIGKVDFIRLIVAICVMIGFYMLAAGKITPETFKELIKLII